MKQTVEANPTKRFFVNSLTRDINLEDAILDLLDNCVDGIMRTNKLKGEGNSSNPYQGFEAHLTLNAEQFEIIDNCGGIPLDKALRQAFKFGRSGDHDTDENLPTVGMYGIGMKRAMFKMGKTAFVKSSHKPHRYYVEITEDWLFHDEDNWKLELNEEEYVAGEDGTTITVSKLYPSISKQFDSSESNFIDDLKNSISHTFSLIMNKGFRIFINNDEISPVSLDLLSVEDLSENGEAAISPYVYKGKVGAVDVKLAIGFYRPLASLSEIEESGSVESKRENAGITVICNDRVILYKNKDKKTGWGVAGVPSFHNQFISIAGIVIFSSHDSNELPLTTTKRGIDLGSDVYWHALEYIRKGLKKFTDFTNHWKGREKEVTQAFMNAKSTNTLDFIDHKVETNLRKVPRTEDEYQYHPNLPKPEFHSDSIRIAFQKKKADVKKLNEFYFEEDEKTPSDLGSWCFDQALDEIELRAKKI